jgi:hypothetical protein
MTMLQIHIDALNSVSAAYHEFLLRYKASANIVYGIVEGKEDPMFYRGLIERQLPEGWEVELVPAGCKDNVLRAKDAFDWSRFSPRRICFFVDRDLSDFVSEGATSGENVYVTDNYSIENDAVNLGVLKRLLTEVLSISDLKPTEWEVIEQRFSSALAAFQNSMVPIMAQIVLWRRDGKRPCLNDIRPKDFFVFVDGNIRLRNEFESALSRLQHAGVCVNLQLSQHTEVSGAEAEFRQHKGAERFVRGKYLLWFLIEFALEIHRSISVLIRRFKDSPKVRISIGPANAMVVLAPRVRCPGSLQEFLERTYGQYIRDRNHHLIPEGSLSLGATA